MRSEFEGGMAGNVGTCTRVHTEEHTLTLTSAAQLAGRRSALRLAARPAMVVVSRDRWCQHDICSDRPPDLGSSCCTLFCAQLAARVLASASEAKAKEALNMVNVQALLWVCVKEWDRMNKDGAAPSESLELVCAREGLELKISVDDMACDMDALVRCLVSASRGTARSQFGAVITGIPHGGDRQATVGDTFLLLGLQTRVVVVDTHRHRGEREAGTVIAESQTMEEIVQWIFKVLLKEIACSLEYVSVTVFRLKRALLSADMTLADFARQVKRPSQEARTPSSDAPRDGGAARSQGSQPSQKARTSSDAPRDGGAARSQGSGSGGGGKAERSPAVGDAARSRGNLADAVGSRGDGGAVPCVVLSAATRHTCTKFSAKCAECMWKKHGQKWQDLVSFVDASGTKVAPIVEKPKHLGGAWGIGCALCANARGTTTAHKHFQAWAKFEVREVASVKKLNIQRHCKSEHHRAAVRMAQQPHHAASSQQLAVSGSQPVSGSKPEPALDGVPRAERFVWAIQNVARGGSFRDFEKWCETNDLTSHLTSQGVCRDSSKQCAAKVTFCVAAARVEERQQLLRRALRLAFAVDDRDQVFVMRARVSFLRPKAGSEDFFVGLVRDYGYNTEDSAEAIYECLRSLCTVRRGRRFGSQPGWRSETSESCAMAGPEDYVDKELLKRVVNITVAGASDGCKVALNSVQEVQKRHLKNLRYQFRDRPHTTRTCQKGILKYMNEGQELMSALISGKQSFAKRCKHSRRFQQIWLRKQAEAIGAARRRSGSSGSQPGISGSSGSPDSEPDLFVALANLAHAEHRFDSRSEPMSIMCSRFGVIIEVPGLLHINP